jgi:hypothetical protein
MRAIVGLGLLFLVTWLVIHCVAGGRVFEAASLGLGLALLLIASAMILVNDMRRNKCSR